MATYNYKQLTRDFRRSAGAARRNRRAKWDTVADGWNPAHAKFTAAMCAKLSEDLSNIRWYLLCASGAMADLSYDVDAETDKKCDDTKDHFDKTPVGQSLDKLEWLVALYADLRERAESMRQALEDIESD